MGGEVGHRGLWEAILIEGVIARWASFLATSGFYPCFWGGFYPSFGPPEIAVVTYGWVSGWVGGWVGGWDGAIWDDFSSWTCSFPVGDMDQPLSSWGYGLGNPWMPGTPSLWNLGACPASCLN